MILFVHSTKTNFDIGLLFNSARHFSKRKVLVSEGDAVALRASQPPCLCSSLPSMQIPPNNLHGPGVM